MINDTVSERILIRLKDDILSGVYKPGDRLLYEKIASKLEVSLTPVKEAILRLEQEGIVKTTPRKGACVTLLTDQDIIEYSRIRLALESLAIDMICEQRIPAEEIDRLGPINEEIEKAVKRKQKTLCLRKDMEFHYMIVELSRNHRLIETIKQMPLTNFFAVLGTQNRMIENGRVIIEKHGKIIEGLKRYDAEAVKALLKANTLLPHLSAIDKSSQAE